MSRKRDTNSYSSRSSSLILLLVLAQLSHVSAASASSTTTTTEPPAASSTTTSRYDNPLVEHKHEQNCKALCEHCGCLGFYCGEECICECNDENSDTECIHTMQLNARTLNSPFEILIQGPSSNRFVRNAQQFEQKCEPRARSAAAAAASKTTRNRRSTITIYKPELKRAALSPNALETPALAGNKKSQPARHKRSVEHLEWFNDFASTLVRPSPLGTRAKPAAFKRQAAATAAPLVQPLREPWFFEPSATRLNRPAPRRNQIASRKSSARKAKPAVSSEADEEPKSETNLHPLRDALQVVERIPRVLQDTVTHLTADNSAGHGDVFSLNRMNDVLPKPLQRQQPNARRRMRERVQATAPPTTTQAPVVVPEAAPLPPRGLFLPWLRQRRLLRMRAGQ
ncbi:hypothetical protein KR222_009106 [Zaprionus bogoriensis]|nr:hypothetical protein KR222_009106 [Zaprionus bogoriensis]